jgi:sterol-4alpha-carboxylate 3-dehydrogenase (decarboxylating)
VPLDHERVDGEAFFITNDAPVYFWDFSRAFYRAFGSEKDYRNAVWVLGDSIAYFFGACSEAVAAVRRTSPNFTTQVVTISGMTRYYNISKAKRVLGYAPQWTLQEGVDRAAKWLLELEKTTGKQEGVPRGRKA